MDLAIRPRRDLYPGDELHACVTSGGSRLIQAVHGVVVGDGDELRAERRDVRDGLGGGKSAVGRGGVEVQIRLHSSPSVGASTLAAASGSCGSMSSNLSSLRTIC